MLSLQAKPRGGDQTNFCDGKSLVEGDSLHPLNMKNSKLTLHSLGHAILVFLYISGVAWILFNGQRVFGQFQNFWGPLAILLLFVLSATIVGTLVLGRPAILYFNNYKKEAFIFFGYTVGWIFLITVIVFSLHLWR